MKRGLQEYMCMQVNVTLLSKKEQVAFIRPGCVIRINALLTLNSRFDIFQLQLRAISILIDSLAFLKAPYR